MNCISASVGLGLNVISHGLSVVPAIVDLSHGRKKITRPSKMEKNLVIEENFYKLVN